MRDILFRGKAGNKWWYGDAHSDYKGVLSKIIVPSFCWKTETIETQCAGYFGVEPNTIGLFTGIMDKNGNKIFEDDIVRVGLKEYIVCYGFHKIPCCGCCFAHHNSIGFYLKNIETGKIESDEETFTEYQGLEIIGNVFDNPELLQGE